MFEAAAAAAAPVGQRARTQSPLTVSNSFGLRRTEKLDNIQQTQEWRRYTGAAVRYLLTVPGLWRLLGASLPQVGGGSHCQSASSSPLTGFSGAQGFFRRGRRLQTLYLLCIMGLCEKFSLSAQPALRCRRTPRSSSGLGVLERPAPGERKGRASEPVRATDPGAAAARHTPPCGPAPAPYRTTVSTSQ